jgi:hypothetical protein
MPSGAQEGNTMGNCPTCGSPDPKKHPAMQFEGEVQPCRDVWHMPETPETVEVNVVMGAQLRAIVRSALLHVRNKIKDSDNGYGSLLDKEETIELIDEELEKWPLGGGEADQPEDTLAQWLWKRYRRDVTGPARWDEIPQEDKQFWEHEAAAVRRAVGRGGFKTPLEISTRERHLLLADILQKYHSAGNMMVSIQQVMDLLTGRAAKEEYSSPLQVRPMAAIEQPNVAPSPKTPGFDGPEGTEWPGGKAR